MHKERGERREGGGREGGGREGGERREGREGGGGREEGGGREGGGREEGERQEGGRREEEDGRRGMPGLRCLKEVGAAVCIHSFVQRRQGGEGSGERDDASIICTCFPLYKIIKNMKEGRNKSKKKKKKRRRKRKKKKKVQRWGSNPRPEPTTPPSNTLKNKI